MNWQKLVHIVDIPITCRCFDLAQMVSQTLVCHWCLSAPHLCTFTTPPDQPFLVPPPICTCPCHRPASGLFPASHHRRHAHYSALKPDFEWLTYKIVICSCHTFQCFVLCQIVFFRPCLYLMCSYCRLLLMLSAFCSRLWDFLLLHLCGDESVFTCLSCHTWILTTKPDKWMYIWKTISWS